MNSALSKGIAGATQKIKRARRHIQELEQIQRLIPLKCGNRLPQKLSPDGSVAIGFSDIGSLGDDIPLVIGDAIHNLRSPLDHIWTAFGRAANAESAKFMTFPFHQTRKNTEDSVEKSGLLKKFPQLRGIILEEIKPFPEGDGNFLLWMTSKLDKLDKHNMIIPTLKIHKIKEVTIYQNGRAVFRVENLTATNCYQLGSFGPGAWISNKGSFDVQMSFSEQGPLYGEPVISVLHKMADAVTEAVCTFQRRFEL